MATAAAPRNEIYLSVLAGKAITALADLADAPSSWDVRIEVDLRGGIKYCQAIRAQESRVASMIYPRGWNALKRSVDNVQETRTASSETFSESLEVEHFLSEVLSNRARALEISRITTAIEFFGKTATDR